MCGENPNGAAVHGIANVRFGIRDSMQPQSVALSSRDDSRVECELIFSNGSVVDGWFGRGEKVLRNVGQVRVVVLHDDDWPAGDRRACDDLPPTPIQCIDSIVTVRQLEQGTFRSVPIQIGLLRVAYING